MKLYYKNDAYMLYEGSMLDMLDQIDKNSIDSIVTDPPYELNFMNKGWDNSGIAFQPGTWKKCYEVLNPGGYLLAFGSSRTFHRIAVAIEDAGFEIRDTIMWLYGSGFPKSMDIEKAINKKDLVQTEESTEKAKQWAGWGTALKPAYEPIIIARKPCEGSVTDNVLKWGVGGINIDDCRVGNEERTQFSGRCQSKSTVYNSYNQDNAHYETVQGRFPANVILTYDKTDEQEVCGGFPETSSNGGKTTMSDFSKYNGSMMNTSNLKADSARKESDYIAPADSGSASRYFYCAKASKKDRDEGLDNFVEKQKYYCDGRANSLEIFGSTDGGRKPLKNIHPTVKPTELMQYLVRLVTPKNGTILDHFNGSGSTGKAVVFENRVTDKNYKYIGIELNREYLDISKARIDWANTIKLNAVTKNNSSVTDNKSVLF